jgi:hypothetical protein
MNQLTAFGQPIILSLQADGSVQVAIGGTVPKTGFVDIGIYPTGLTKTAPEGLNIVAADYAVVGRFAMGDGGEAHLFTASRTFTIKANGDPIGGFAVVLHQASKQIDRVIRANRQIKL